MWILFVFSKTNDMLHRFYILLESVRFGLVHVDGHGVTYHVQSFGTYECNGSKYGLYTTTVLKILGFLQRKVESWNGITSIQNSLELWFLRYCENRTSTSCILSKINTTRPNTHLMTLKFNLQSSFFNIFENKDFVWYWWHLIFLATLFLE